jgi:hypothetical protein
MANEAWDQLLKGGTHLRDAGKYTWNWVATQSKGYLSQPIRSPSFQIPVQENGNKFHFQLELESPVSVCLSLIKEYPGAAQGKLDLLRYSLLMNSFNFTPTNQVANGPNDVNTVVSVSKEFNLIGNWGMWFGFSLYRKK